MEKKNNTCDKIVDVDFLVCSAHNLMITIQNISIIVILHPHQLTTILPFASIAQTRSDTAIVDIAEVDWRGSHNFTCKKEDINYTQSLLMQTILPFYPMLQIQLNLFRVNV